MWPEGKACAVTLNFHFDAEEVWLADDPGNANKPAALSQGTYGAKRGVPLILEMLERYSLPATFFVPGRVAERHPQRIEEILKAGHDIALHGYTHRSPSGLSRDEENEEFERALEVLRGLGADPVGYCRTTCSNNTLSLLEKYGVKFDSSFMDDIYPYRLSDSVIELPFSWLLDDAPHFWFGDGSDWNRKISTPSEVREIWEAEFDAIYELGGIFDLCLHPQVIGRPSRLKMLEGLLQAILAKSDVWIASMRDVAAFVDQALPLRAAPVTTSV